MVIRSCCCIILIFTLIIIIIHDTFLWCPSIYSRAESYSVINFDGKVLTYLNNKNLEKSLTFCDIYCTKKLKGVLIHIRTCLVYFSIKKLGIWYGFNEIFCPSCKFKLHVHTSHSLLLGIGESERNELRSKSYTQ